MKFWISLILTSLLITSSSFAQEAVYLEKDQKSPYAGVLMPESKVLELRNNTLERDTLKGQNASLNVSLKLQDEIIGHKTDQVGILLEQNDKLVKTAYSERSMTNLERGAWFLGGMFAAYFAVKAGQAVLKW